MTNGEISFDFELTKENEKALKELLKEGHKVIYSHILEGKDFFEYEPDSYDCIVSNPPYSLKNEFLRRCYEYKKPFCLLLPITNLEGIERGKMFRENSVELLVLDRRCNFIYNNAKKSNWFNTSWFCWNILPRQLIFEELIK